MTLRLRPCLLACAVGAVAAMAARPATADEARYRSGYFPELARQVLADEPGAFAELLAVAHDTPGGAKLEELAELSSRYLAINPRQFLRDQSGSTHCFGVDFMGDVFVDRDETRQAERAMRIELLESIDDPELAASQSTCLRELRR